MALPVRPAAVNISASNLRVFPSQVEQLADLTGDLRSDRIPGGNECDWMQSKRGNNIAETSPLPPLELLIMRSEGESMSESASQ